MPFFNLICLDVEGVYAFALEPYTSLSSLTKVGETSQMRTISRKTVKALCLQSLRVELGLRSLPVCFTQNSLHHGQETVNRFRKEEANLNGGAPGGGRCYRHQGILQPPELVAGTSRSGSARRIRTV